MDFVLVVMWQQFIIWGRQVSIHDYLQYVNLSWQTLSATLILTLLCLGCCPVICLSCFVEEYLKTLTGKSLFMEGVYVAHRRRPPRKFFFF